MTTREEIEYVNHKLNQLPDEYLRTLAAHYFKGTVYELLTYPDCPFSENELLIIVNDIYKPFCNMLDVVADVLETEKLLSESSSTACDTGQKLKRYIGSGQVQICCPVENTVKELTGFPKLRRFDKDMI